MSVTMSGNRSGTATVSEPKPGVNHKAFRRIPATLLLASGLCGAGFAQAPDEMVHWAASLDSRSAVKHGSPATLKVSGDVLEGWHVYALTQPPGGPTALRVTLDKNPVVRLAGSPTGTAPEEKHDPSFDLDTQFYTHSFALLVPVYVKRRAAAGQQLIPVSVRFQTCSDRECRPPRTIHFSVAIDVLPDA